MYYVTTHPSPIGTLTIASDETSLVGLWIAGQKHHGKGLTEVKESHSQPIFLKVKNWLDSYFAGENPAAENLNLAPSGTPFQQQVWKILQTIPYGQVVTYKHIAQQIQSITNMPTSARAVGGAVGRNPISIIIPCHRVVSTDKKLTGFSAGVNIKNTLLSLEGIHL